MNELDSIKDRLRQRLINSNDDFPTERSLPRDTSMEVRKNSDHQTKTDDGLTKVASSYYGSNDLSSVAMQLNPSNILPRLKTSSFSEDDLEGHYVCKDIDTNVDTDNVNVACQHHRGGNYFIEDDDYGNNKPAENRYIDGKGDSNDDKNHFTVDTNDDNNDHHLHVGDNTYHGAHKDGDVSDSFSVDGDLDGKDIGKQNDFDETIRNSEVNLDGADASGDESLDSFFDCLTSKPNPVVDKGIVHHCDEINDTVDSQSLVTMNNVEKLKNVLIDRKNYVSHEVNVNRDLQDVDNSCPILSSSYVMGMDVRTVRDAGGHIPDRPRDSRESDKENETNSKMKTAKEHTSANETTQEERSHFTIPSYPFILPYNKPSSK